MEDERSAKIAQDLALLNKEQEKLFILGWRQSKLDSCFMIAALFAIGAGLYGIIGILDSGINIQRALMLLAGAAALVISSEKDKKLKQSQERYRANREAILLLEDEYKILTFTPDSAEESERKLRELLTECDQAAASRLRT